MKRGESFDSVAPTEPVFGSLQKPCRTDRKKKKKEHKLEATRTENNNKRAAKARDKHRCRFPLCGCKKLGLALDARIESSHDRHKGTGGNPAGDRSVREMLMTLCFHRHQDGAVSRHKGTLRTRYLTSEKNDGPVAWLVECAYALEALRGADRRLPSDGLPVEELDGERGEWVEVAREKAVQQLEPLLPWQRAILEQLAEMTL